MLGDEEMGRYKEYIYISHASYLMLFYRVFQVVGNIHNLLIHTIILLVPYPYYEDL
jgi:hypothetical protein